MPVRGFHKSENSIPFQGFHNHPPNTLPSTISSLEPILHKLCFHTILPLSPPNQDMNEYGIQWSPYSNVLNYISSSTNPFTQGFSSLRRVSEAFTPMKKFQHSTKQGDQRRNPKKIHETIYTITTQHKIVDVCCYGSTTRYGFLLPYIFESVHP